VNTFLLTFAPCGLSGPPAGVHRISMDPCWPTWT